MRAAASRPPRAISSIGIAAPTLYATVAAIVRKPKFSRAAAVVTAARNGPAHGTKTSPSVTPRKNPPPAFAGPQAREERERALEPERERRHEQHRRHHEEQRDREVAQQILRQPELVEQPRREEREDAEAENQARR